VSTAFTLRPGISIGFTADQREHAASAEGDADAAVLAAQRPRRLDEILRLVVLAELGAGEDAKLGLVEHEDVDEREQFRPDGARGAGLRMVVASAARARWKNAVIAGRGISNWLTAMSPLAKEAAATSAASTSALAPGTTTMVLSELATVMIAVPV
jgi:hypothetical protein